jgi:hypothetical protein
MSEQRANRRATRRMAALQRPRRKPKFEETVVEDVAVVQSEAEPSDSTEAESETVETKKFEEPLKYGDVD